MECWKRPGGARQRLSGSVFILVLWTLFFLGALSLAVGTLVGANISQASHTKSRTTAYMLARAGVERAIFDVIQNPTNWVLEGAAEPRSNEELFRDNDDLPGGTFSVTYHYVPEGEAAAVTNYGLMSEEVKMDLHTYSRGKLGSELERRVGLGEEVAEGVAKAIIDARKGLTDQADISYAHQLGDSYIAHKKRFRLLAELLLIDVFEKDTSLFARVEPYLTVHGEDHFSGTSSGKVPVPTSAWGGSDGDVLAEAHIDFVVNSSGSVLYWHEY